MKILLISPPDDRLIEARSREVIPLHPPTSLVYLAGYVRKMGYDDLTIWDCNADGSKVDDLEKAFLLLKPDVVGVSTYTPMSEVAAAVGRLAKKTLPRVVTVAGGPHCQVLGDPFGAESKAFDYVVKAEGELAFVALLSALEKGERAPAIPGVSCFDDGMMLRSTERSTIENLDEVSMPAWDLVDLRRYSSPQTLGDLSPFADVIGSRGCPFQCTFCTSPSTYDRKVRKRSPENLMVELRRLVRDLGVKAVRFEDDLFIADKKWVGQICDMIMKEGLRFHWEANVRVDVATLEILELMKAAGCVSVSFGVEFADEHILAEAKKGIDLVKVAATNKMAKKLGLKTKAFFMFGYPTETLETMEKTIQFSVHCGVDYGIYCLVTPFPGTELWDYCEKNDLIVHRDWEDYQFGVKRRPIRYENFTEEQLYQVYESAPRRFYMHPPRFLKTTLNHPFFVLKTIVKRIWSMIFPARPST